MSGDLEPGLRRLDDIGSTAAELVARFVSLGDNCEFGLVQRHFGAEPASVFRFANPKVHAIHHGAKTRFADLGQDVGLELDRQQPRREWILIDRIYHTRQHTFVYEGDPREATIHDEARKYYALLKRSFLEDLEEASKIFVIKSVPTPPRDLIEEIAAGLRRIGPNWLLWVVDEPGDVEVEIVAEGLLRARVEGILPENHPRWLNFDFSYDRWLTALARAWALTRAPLRL